MDTADKKYKYAVILLDGMSDLKEAGKLTPMEAADKPVIDSLVKFSETGLVQTIADGMDAGSDTANMTVLGYDARKYYTGRSPLEALSMGIELEPGDVTYRVNLVKLSNEERYEDKKMLDYSGGEISTEAARELIEKIKPIAPSGSELFAGVSYRHILLFRGGHKSPLLTPPHDITGKRIKEYLPCGELYEFMKKSAEILKGECADSAWIWGGGTRPSFSKFKKSGSVISAVDLIKGLGKATGLKVKNVENATGTIRTNFEGKARAAIEALAEDDFVYVHLEAPDECGHQGDYHGKIRSIELIDQKIVKPIKEYLDSARFPYRLLIMPDHSTPVAKRTHTREAIPYLLYDSENKINSAVTSFTEASASKSGIFICDGHTLINRLLK